MRGASSCYGAVVERLERWGFEEPTRSAAVPFTLWYASMFGILGVAAAYFLISNRIILIPLAIILAGASMAGMMITLQSPIIARRIKFQCCWLGVPLLLFVIVRRLLEAWGIVP
jgi:hypothetical protein